MSHILAATRLLRRYSTALLYSPLVQRHDCFPSGGHVLRRDITLAEVAEHKTPEDGWMVIKGKVYNIGPYLPYHPGGVAILRAQLGKDATEFFARYHPWVNIDMLVGKCLVGLLKRE